MMSSSKDRMRNLLAIFLTVGLSPTCAIFATEIDPEAEMKFERLKGVGVSIAYPVKDEPWRQQRFGLFNSVDMWVDAV